MSNMDDFFWTLIFCTLVFGLIFYNTDRVVHSSEFYTAEGVCKINGGLSKLSFDMRDYTIECESGAIFVFDENKFYEMTRKYEEKALEKEGYKVKVYE